MNENASAPNLNPYRASDHPVQKEGEIPVAEIRLSKRSFRLDFTREQAMETVTRLLRNTLSWNIFFVMMIPIGLVVLELSGGPSGYKVWFVLGSAILFSLFAAIRNEAIRQNPNREIYKGLPFYAGPPKVFLSFASRALIELQLHPDYLKTRSLPEKLPADGSEENTQSEMWVDPEAMDFHVSEKYGIVATWRRSPLLVVPAHCATMELQADLRDYAIHRTGVKANPKESEPRDFRKLARIEFPSDGVPFAGSISVRELNVTRRLLGLRLLPFSYLSLVRAYPKLVGVIGVLFCVAIFGLLFQDPREEYVALSIVQLASFVLGIVIAALLLKGWVSYRNYKLDLTGVVSATDLWIDGGSYVSHLSLTSFSRCLIDSNAIHLGIDDPVSTFTLSRGMFTSSDAWEAAVEFAKRSRQQLRQNVAG